MKLKTMQLTDLKDKIMTELQALENAVKSVGLNGLQVHEYMQTDKRKTTKLYFLTHFGSTISPRLDYKNMNHFILGFINAQVIKDKMPPCKTYGEYLHKASQKFNISVDLCRLFFGTYTIEQWDNILTR